MRAPFATRAAAWSLDAAACGLAVALAFHARLAAGAAAVDRHVLDLYVQAYAAMARQGAAGAALPDPVALARDPALLAAIGTLRDALADMLAGPSLAFGVAMLLLQAAGDATLGGSPGKRALGLRVARGDGGPPGRWRVVARQLAGLASWATLNLGHLMAMGPRRLALHDRLAGTCVLQLRPPPRWARTWLAVQGGLAVLATAGLLAYLLGRAAEAAGQVFG